MVTDDRKANYAFLNRRISRRDVARQYPDRQRYERTNHIQFKHIVERRQYPRGHTHADYEDHERGAVTLYFTGNESGDELIGGFDIDCKDGGSRQGSDLAADFLASHFGKRLYVERSGGGIGSHALFRIKKGDHAPRRVAKAMDRLEKYISQFSGDFDITGIEVKGQPPHWKYKDKSRESVQYAKQGRLLRVPRNLSDPAIQDIDSFTVEELERLPITKRKSPRRKTGSVSGHPIPDWLVKSIHSGQCKQLAYDAINTGGTIYGKQRHLVVTEDVAIFLAIFHYASHLAPNQDGSVPYLRFDVIWQALYEEGLVSRCYDHRRYKAVWCRLNRIGWLHVDDARYWPTQGNIEGQAARWHIDSGVAASISQDDPEGAEVRERACYTQIVRPNPELLVLVDPMRHFSAMAGREPPLKIAA